MTDQPLRPVVRHVRRLAGRPHDPQATDQELLRRFLDTADGRAFEGLVRRHGPMVREVCRRLLGQDADDDDALQATFLVLALQARSIRKQRSLASWLYGVAYRTAQRAKRDAARRGERERHTAGRASADPAKDAAWRELCEALDAELHRLPEADRQPLVLCYLQGRTRDEAAKELGWSVRTLDRRLGRGRELLRVRLARRGLTLSAALLAVGLTDQGACATGAGPEAVVPAGLAEATARAAVAVATGEPAAGGGATAGAAALAQRGLPGGVSWKFKVAALAVLALGAAALGAGMLRQPPPEEQPPVETKQPVRDAGESKTPEFRRPGTDRHGDPLPPEAIARLGTVRLRHGDGAWSVALSRDGKVIVSGSGSFDPTVRVWELPTGKELKRLHAYPGFPVVMGGVLAIALSPDGKTIAAATYGSAGNPIFLWDAHSGRRRHALRGHRGGVQAVAFSPDGKALASASSDETVCLWDTDSGAEVRKLTGHRGGASAVAFSPDGATLASGGADRAVRLWDARTGKETARLEGHGGAILSVAFGHDGKVLASAGRDGTVRLWDPAATRKLRTLTGHRGDVSSVAFSPDGALLASASRDGTVRLWGVALGKELRQLPADRLDFSSVAFSADGKRLAAGAFTNGICVWDVDTGAELLPAQGHRAWVLSLQYSPDGALLASGGADGTVRLSSPGSGTERRRIAVGGGWVRGLAFSPDGKALAVADGESALTLREVGSGKLLRSFPGHGGGAVCAAFSPDGTSVASVAGDGKVHLWDVLTGAGRNSLPGAGESCSVAFAPGGSMLAVGGGLKDRTISLREVSTGKELRRLTGHAYAVTSLAFLPGGEALISGSPDGTLRLWDVATGRERLCLRRSPEQGLGGFNGLSLSPDGRFVASAGQDRAVRVWELATGQEVRAFRGHQGEVYAVAFAPDGKALASGGRDSTVLVWDAGGRTASGGRKGGGLSGQEVETLWAGLASPEGARGERAMWALVGAPGQSLAVLRERLRPIPAPEAGRVNRLVGELAAARFATREAATAELERLGEAARPALHKALAGEPPLEVRRRIERLLGRVEGSERLRAARALAALERIGTAEARRVLERLAGGAPEARLTREARAALERLGRRPAAAP